MRCSTPLIACSSGAATVSAITWLFAPGYVARTTTVGGTTSGYSEIGSSRSDSAPAIKMIAESTAAKIGRRTKNCENSMARSLAHRVRERFCGHFRVGGPEPLERARRVTVHRDLRRADRHAGPHTLQAVDDHDVARLEPALDHSQALERAPRLDLPVRHDVLRVDNEHELAA